jgi:choline dehydrogenase-like flavoprotein
MQLFLPVSKMEAASLFLNQNGKLEIHGKRNKISERLIMNIIKILRILGGYTGSSLVVKVENGHGIHYAGTLPMRDSPDREYTCSKFGELYGESGVYVVDGSLFPVIPAKNSSFTVMANAMRIADYISSLMGG